MLPSSLHASLFSHASFFFSHASFLFHYFALLSYFITSYFLHCFLFFLLAVYYLLLLLLLPSLKSPQVGGMCGSSP
jgi:hypothetical protein